MVRVSDKIIASAESTASSKTRKEIDPDQPPFPEGEIQVILL